MIEIKEASLKDLPGLREVAISSYSDTFAVSNTEQNMRAFFNEAYTLAAFENEFNESNTCTYLAWESNTIVGFVRLRECDEVKTLLGTNTVELHRLYVLTTAQGKSVGRFLMEKALDWASKKKYEWMWLGVWEKNFKAQKFYEKWGFEKFSEHVFLMGDDPQIDWLLKKPL
jgi:ribosomal protein S18 acetylase RimI-like enzyme